MRTLFNKYPENLLGIDQLAFLFLLGLYGDQLGQKPVEEHGKLMELFAENVLKRRFYVTQI